MIFGWTFTINLQTHNPTAVYLFKINRRNTITMWEIFIFDFEQISHIVLLFPLLEK